MRATCLLALLALASCQRPAEPAPPIEPEATSPESEVIETPEPAAGPEASVARVNSTRQRWSPGQPWEKQPPRKQRSLGAIVADHQILTTAEMVADATFLEFESVDGKRLATAKVIAVDYEANLALLGLENEEDASFFEGTVPLEIAEFVGLGDEISIVQIEANGTPLVTTGPVQSIDVISNFLPGQYFLAYEVKASMQSAASSFTLPALHDGKLAGLLTSYNSKDQLSDISGTEILSRFLADAADGDYQGFPSLGISVTSTNDSNFRAWLKIPADEGGLYVSKVRKGSAADKAGLKKGDVIISIDGHEIDRMGYFEHQLYGRLYWSHLVRGAKGADETVALDIMRDGEAQTINAALQRRQILDELVPAYTFGKAPNFLVKGGLIFQELTIPLLQSFGEEWRTRAPLNLLDVLENPDKYEEKVDRAVLLAGVIPTPATVGYEPLRNLIVTEVNGQPIRNMKGLIAAFDATPDDGLHSIRFDEENFSVYLDEVTSTAVDTQLLQRGLNQLSRAE